jgi:hypothetical protein
VPPLKPTGGGDIECRNIMHPPPGFRNTLMVELNLTLWAILFAAGSPIIIIRKLLKKLEPVRVRGGHGESSVPPPPEPLDESGKLIFSANPEIK